MNTIYKTRNDHLYQTLRKEAFNTQDINVQQEVLRNCGSLNFSATIIEDTQTKNLLKHIPSLVAFLCVLKKDGLVIGEGRGSTVLGRASKYLEKAVRASCNASLIDAFVKSIKNLDSLQLNDKDQQSNSGIKLDESYQIKEIENSDSITDKQMSYLMTLIRANVAENKREEMEKQIAGYSRDQASEAIKSFVK